MHREIKAIPLALVLLVFAFWLGEFSPARAQAVADPLQAAEAAYDQKKYDAARTQFEAVLKTKLDTPVRRRGQHLLALTYFALGDTRKAVDQWEGIYDESSSDDVAVKAAYNLGLGYSRLGDPKRAYESLAKVDNGLLAQQSQPVQRAYTELLGQTATAMDKNESAVLAFSSGLQMTTDAKARKGLLDQLAAAAQKLDSADKLQKLANEVKDEEAKKRILEAKDAQAKKEAENPAPPPVPYHDFVVTPLVSLSRMDYTQTAVDLLQLTAINLGVGGGFRFNPNWKVKAGAELYAVSLQTKGNDTSTRLVTGHLGLEYLVVSNPVWQVATELAYTYASLLTPMNKYGFRDLAGPQLKVSIFRSLNAADGLKFDLGGAILNNDASQLTLDSRRFFGGLAYRWTYSEGLPPIEIGLRYTDHSLDFRSSSAKGKMYDLVFTSDFDFDW